MKLTIINEEIYLKDKQQFKDFNIDCHFNDLLEDNLKSLIFDEDDYPHILHLSFLQMKSKIYQSIQENNNFCCVLRKDYIKQIIEFVDQFKNVELTILD